MLAVRCRFNHGGEYKQVGECKAGKRGRGIILYMSEVLPGALHAADECLKSVRLIASFRHLSPSRGYKSDIFTYHNTQQKMRGCASSKIPFLLHFSTLLAVLIA